MAVNERKGARILRSELYGLAVQNKDRAKIKAESFKALGVSDGAAEALVDAARQAFAKAREGDTGTANRIIELASNTVASEAWEDIEAPEYDARELAAKIMDGGY